MKFNYEGHSLKAGIYKIVNTHNGRTYIGSAARFKTRWQDGHVKHLLKGKHQNRFIQADFDKCRDELGHDDFLEFHVIQLMEGSTKEERKVAEQAWIDKHFDNGNQCYNLKRKTSISREDVPSKNPEATRQKCAKASSQMWAAVSEEEKARRIALMQAGKDEEWKRKIGNSLRGKPKSSQHIEKCRIANLGQKRKPHSAEARQRMSENKKDKRQIEAIELATGIATKHVSLTAAAKATEVSIASVAHVASGKYKSAKGFSFRYLS